MNRRPGYLPEDEELLEGPQQISETVSLPQDEVPGLEIDPALQAAREARDSRIANSYLFEGISDIGSALAGVKPNDASYESYRKGAGQSVTDASTDSERRAKAVAAHLKSKAEKQKLASDEAKYASELEYKKERDAADESFRRDQLKETIAARLQLAKMNQAEKQAATAQRAADKEEQRNKPSDANNLSAGYGKRMEQAEGDFASLENKGFNRADRSAALQDAAANLPMVGDIVRATVQGEDSKLQEQAELNFLSAVLRRESGASIAPSEREKGALQYFPRVGDSPEVIAQKKRNRQQAMESLKASAGPAWDKTPLVGGNAGGGSGMSPEARRKRIQELRAKQNAAQ